MKAYLHKANLICINTNSKREEMGAAGLPKTADEPHITKVRWRMPQRPPESTCIESDVWSSQGIRQR